jgi:hypothetical protein
MTNDSIIDTTKPNAGRIYDYILGGHHNFEIDRQSANQLLGFLPGVEKAMRLQRWCLQDVAEEIVDRGFKIIIDFASGLPTQDHIHQVVPNDMIVIYSDKDPVTVEYAKDIVKDIPNVYVFESDAAHPEILLENPQVQNILGGQKDVAFVLWGVSFFLTDDELLQAIRYLYDWSGSNTCFAFQAQGADMNAEHPAMKKAIDLYKSMGSQFYIRPLEHYLQLIQPWKVDKGGFVSLSEWHDLEENVTDYEKDTFNSAMGGYGAYLVK